MRVAATYKLLPTSSQRGQSLIETIMAIFILTTGLASGLALAIFAFGSSSDITARIAATGLAREGIEAVRRMRDSNWLMDPLADCGSGQFCHPNWLTRTYNIHGSAAGIAYRVVFNPGSTTNRWTPDNLTDYRLYTQAGGGLSHNSGGALATSFFRKIIITYQNTSAPYSATSPLVRITSTVWWWGKRCAPITDYNGPADTNCKITTEEYLTNWKNY